nr:glycosyltransferase family 39 protein [Smaragdicoccus niigatensis]
MLEPLAIEPEPVAVHPRKHIWERVGLVVLLVGTAVAYLWNITINGMANGFYAGAAWAGSKNWEALLFGSVDPSNFITVDKPPVSQWVMGLSGKIFGFSSASMLVPEALMAVAAVALLYGAVARVSGRGAGLLAGTALAILPVAALMFRFNNPDAAMVLLMMAAAYCTIRAIEKGSVWWVALTGVALGFAFLAKMLEGLMVMPALAIAYLIAAPIALSKRIQHTIVALVATVVSSGWYVLLTILWPASSRPYMAGSTDNSFMNLVIGYNGLSRILGRNRGGGAGQAMGQNFRGAGQTFQGVQLPPGVTQQQVQQFMQRGGFGSQSAGLGRLFNGEVGFEISWLLPAALVAFVLVLVARRSFPRTDLVRAAALVFGLWLIVDGLVLSFMKQLTHAYYTLAIGPAIAGLVGLGIHEMWVRRQELLGRIGNASIILAAGGWGFVLLQRNSTWLPEVRWAILIATVVAAAGVFVVPGTPLRRFTTVFVIIGVLAGFGGSTAYAVATLGQAHTGGSPTVGPARSERAGGGRGGFGSFDEQTSANPQLDAMLQATHTKWAAAIDRSSAAAALELSSRTAIMAIGGFNNDPVPTLAQFKQYVKDHQITYYIVGNQGEGRATANRETAGRNRGQRATPATSGFMRGGGHADITAWVEATFPKKTVGNTTVYDLSNYSG